jgi:UDP-glucose 4-epimerase
MSVVLVTGGAGYIDSHVVKLLHDFHVEGLAQAHWLALQCIERKSGARGSIRVTVPTIRLER